MLKNKPAGQVIRTEGVVSLGTFLSFIFGICAAFKIRLVGTLTYQEILILVSTPLLLIKFRTKLERKHLLVVAASVFWLIIQLCTDFVRSIPLEDMSKGAAKIIIFGFSFIFFTLWLDGRLNRYAAFLVGLGLSSVITLYISPTEMSYIDPWKWHFSAAATYCAFGFLLFSSLRGSVMAWAIVSAAIAAVSVQGNARSHAGILVLFVLCIIGNRFMLRFPFLARLAMLAVLAVVIMTGYVSLALSGAMGEEGRKKIEAQFNQEEGIVSIIKDGRAETRASLKAIKDSPLLGYGSWARHPEYIYFLWDGKGEFSNEQFGEMLALGIIPTHSYLFGAWVDAGPLPALFWAFMWMLAAYCIVKIRIGNVPLYILTEYFSILLLWDILFSPFGEGTRVASAFCVVLIMVSLPAVQMRVRQA